MTTPVETTFSEALAALENPLRFASRNGFEKLERVRDLESTLTRGVQRVRGLTVDAALSNVLDEFLQLLPDSGAPRAERVTQLTACLELLERVRGGNEHPATRVMSPVTQSKPGLATGSVTKPAPVAKQLPDGLNAQTSVQYIKGVGPRIAQSLALRSVETVADLLRFLPRRYEDRRSGGAIRDLAEGATHCVEGDVLLVSTRFVKGRRNLDVVIGDDTGRLALKWFRVPGGGFVDRFKKGARIRVSGAVKRYRGKLQMVHPELGGEISHDESGGAEDTLVPGYLEIEGLRPSQTRALIKRVLPVAQSVPEWLPPRLLHSHGLPSWGESIVALHEPPAGTSLEALERMSTPWQRRLIYEELLLLQLVVLQRKARGATEEGISVPLADGLPPTAASLFGFALTAAQSRVLSEIETDLRRAVPMHRLLQGDVGSGKTAVALTAAVGVARAGLQAAIMAPTELLAEQHARVALKTLTPAGIRVGLLTGNLTAPERRQVLAHLKSGHIQVIVGTHALIQESVEFKALGLGIVDEQHRFGVMQRARFVEQGRQSTGRVPHMLVMTATPIPRTLALTVYGDLDVSVIDELPPGRTPIQTRRFSDKQREQVYGLVRQAVDRGRQAYVVLPLVEESDKEGMTEIRDATSTAEELAHGWLSGIAVGLVHGKMSSDEKDRLMRAFARDELKVLVATTVIEVGIDIPNATVMVIEHAERFGLSQLHQLRGRVGRGAHQSECYLVARYTPSEDAWRRLAIMEESTDGFRIAEEDLEIRGPGDFVGTRQSGLPLLSIANLARDQDLLQAARLDAADILGADPELVEPSHHGLKSLLAESWNSRFELAQIG